MQPVNHQWRLRERPVGEMSRAHFDWVEEPIPTPGQGELLARTVYLSLDPTNRIWASDVDGYLPPVPLGDVMRGGTIGVVEVSNAPGFKPGDVIAGFWGWQKYGVVKPPHQVSRVPHVEGVPLSAWTSVVGLTGLTAYIGMLDIAQPREGQTAVVSGAAGAVGSVAGQLAKIKGARVIGIAGGPDKCAWLTSELGFDGAIDYKKQDVASELDRLCPDGIDALFENVGGAVFDASFARMNDFGRIALCGLISGYNSSTLPPDPEILQKILMRRLHVQGFIILDHASRFGVAVPELLGWLREGKLKYRVDVVDGLEEAPDATQRLFNGSNTGKLLVKVSEPPPGAPDALGLVR